MPKTHPTAIVDGRAELADDVEVGPYCVIEGDVRIGPGTRLLSHAVIRRYTTLGRSNLVDSHCVLGGAPQDLKFDQASVTCLRIGDDNVFREGVTISRATGVGNATVVGNRTYWMAGAHAGHNAVVEDEAILINGSAVAGHATLGRRAILSAHAGIHQFCWVGDMTILQGNAGASTHVPPYVMVAGINRIVGLNLVGLQRAGHLTDTDRQQIKEAFRLLYRSGLTSRKALEKMDLCAEWGAAADRFRQFIRRVLEAKEPYDRPLCPTLWTRKH